MAGFGIDFELVSERSQRSKQRSINEKQECIALQRGRPRDNSHAIASQRFVMMSSISEALHGDLVDCHMEGDWLSPVAAIRLQVTPH